LIAAKNLTKSTSISSQLYFFEGTKVKKSRSADDLYRVKVSFTTCQFTFIGIVYVQTGLQATQDSLKNIIINSISSPELPIPLSLSFIIRHSGAKLAGHQEMLFMLY